ncbi:hypothetical protein CLIB1444_10S03114 [[Candida] jaroonii]|uniref:Uncharacterized protein n=1 Tax=[Candida] jaroonii TaxID=467808 RepID=A0ACA9YC51_9ASCO|nr:hypothetical protein CLIB1444_10S03114 [[Candida] jaroonii]
MIDLPLEIQFRIIYYTICNGSDSNLQYTCKRLNCYYNCVRARLQTLVTHDIPKKGAICHNLISLNLIHTPGTELNSLMSLKALKYMSIKSNDVNGLLVFNFIPKTLVKLTILMIFSTPRMFHVSEFEAIARQIHVTENNLKHLTVKSKNAMVHTMVDNYIRLLVRKNISNYCKSSIIQTINRVRDRFWKGISILGCIFSGVLDSLRMNLQSFELVNIDISLIWTTRPPNLEFPYLRLLLLDACSSSRLNIWIEKFKSSNTSLRNLNPCFIAMIYTITDEILTTTCLNYNSWSHVRYTTDAVNDIKKHLQLPI